MVRSSLVSLPSASSLTLLRLSGVAWTEKALHTGRIRVGPGSGLHQSESLVVASVRVGGQPGVTVTTPLVEAVTVPFAPVTATTPAGSPATTCTGTERTAST